MDLFNNILTENGSLAGVVVTRYNNDTPEHFASIANFKRYVGSLPYNDAKRYTGATLATKKNSYEIGVDDYRNVHMRKW